MILYEKAFRLFSMGYRDVSYNSYKFIRRIVQKDQMYEMYETPLGCFIHTNHTHQGRKKRERDNG